MVCVAAGPPPQIRRPTTVRRSVRADNRPTKRPKLRRREVGVDVDVEVELAARLLCVAVQEVAHPRRSSLKVDFGGQQERHTEVFVDINDRGEISDGALEPSLIVEVEPGQLRQASVTLVAPYTVGARPGLLLLLPALRLQSSDVLLRVARAVETAGQAERACGEKQLGKGTPIEVHEILLSRDREL
jgi:hypothetical protein